MYVRDRQVQISSDEMTGPPAAELVELLAEAPGHADDRTRAAALEKTDGVAHYALYGAGQLGRAVLARLRASGIEPVAFADDTTEKQGQSVDGVPVMRPAEVADRFGKGLAFVVTILNPLLNFVTARQRLRELTGARVLSFLDLAWLYPKEFFPYYQFELPSSLLTRASDIRRGFELFDDRESQRQFVAHLKFRLQLDYEALPVNNHADYFPHDVLPSLPADTVFVDCGAYDGDTIRTFIKQQRGLFKAIYAFEPDAENYARLQEYVAALDEHMAARIHLYHAGVGARLAKLRFNAAGNMSSSFSTTGDSEIEVLPVQDIVEPNGAPIYLKFDVEGAEWDALEGCERLLQSGNALLALSIYHRPNDLWELPLYVAAHTRGYRFFLRTQGEDGMDVICFALPPGPAEGPEARQRSVVSIPNHLRNA